MSVGGTGTINVIGTGLSVTNTASSTSGDITINPTGDITGGGGGNGVTAQITNAANNANIEVALPV